MSFEQLAEQDFDRAIAKGFWRKVVSRLTGRENELLPYDEVRERLPLRGQRYLGLKQVLIKDIVGSFGRYQDFDRAFLPTQKHTKDKWVSIDKAHYSDITLPAVDLYKLGEVYFVKDGNHRVSVARELGREFVDAHVIEIDTPVEIDTETSLDDLDCRMARADFFSRTNLDSLCPDINFEMTNPENYNRLLRHIDNHRWYLGELNDREVSMDDAVRSWIENIYKPIAVEAANLNLEKRDRGPKISELVLWVLEYYRYLYQIIEEKDLLQDEAAREEADQKLVEKYPLRSTRNLISKMKHTSWFDEVILNEERANFFRRTGIGEVISQEKFRTTVLGQYRKLLEHIRAHHWYLSEKENREISFEEAIQSWYEDIYSPVIEIIREESIMDGFPGRTETDLYLWIMHHLYLVETNPEKDDVREAVSNIKND